MTLEVLQKEMVAAMKNHDKTRKDTISSLIGAIKKTAIDERCKDNITEELVNRVLIKEKKTMQEMLDTCPADRTDLLDEYNQRMTIINEFVPQLIADETVIANMILSIATENNIVLEKKNKGNVMKVIMPNMRGKADMAIVNKVVSRMLK